MALARAPESLTIRSEVGRTLLDLTAATRADRLRLGRDLLARAGEMAAGLRAASRSSGTGDGSGSTRAPRGRRASTKGLPAMATRTAIVASDSSSASDSPDADVGADAVPGAGKVPASERRAAALALVAIWRDVARDLAMVALGEPADVRQLDLLDDLDAAARRLPAGFAAAQLRRLDVAGERLEGNVSPELVVDALVLGWAA